MRVLVTGGSGFLGRHLVERLERIGDVQTIYSVSRATHNRREIWEVPVPGEKEDDYLLHNGKEYAVDKGERKTWHITCDITVEGSVKLLLDRFKPDVIFHLAANPIVKENAARPTAISHTNYMATHYLLAHCKEGTRFVFASSATIYGDLPKFTRCCELTNPRPNSVYGATKLASEALVTAYTESGRVSGINLRLVANVGWGTTHGILHDFIRKLRSPSSMLEVLGDEPGSIKPYCHVHDTVEVMELAAFDQAWFKGKPYAINVSSDNEVSVAEFAQIVMDTTGIHKPIKWLGASANWKGDNPRVRVHNFRAKKLGWHPKYAKSEDAIKQATLDILAGEARALALLSAQETIEV